MVAPISFVVSAPRPHSHLLAVRMDVPDLGVPDEVVLRMPVWTPGSYLIREYSKQMQNLSFSSADGEALAADKIDKASWRIDISGVNHLVATYEMYAHELSPRHNHLDASHGFFNCVATCLYPAGALDQPVELEVKPPTGWNVFCGLERKAGDGVRFEARDFDELFDTPVEMGPHRWFDFEVRGVPHRFVVWEDSPIDLDALRRDLPTVVEQNVAMFDEVPYDRYVFINHASRGQWGGLEHRHSSVNVFGPQDFDRSERDENGEFGKKYANLLRLFSHEHFHAYHVKRLRPEALGPFDYQCENYTRSLWAVEGVASYFDTYHTLQAGLIGPARYMGLLEDKIKRLQGVPGRLIQSLEEASFDAWIRLYRRDENTRNASVSYYLKGELVTWLLDLWIRDATEGAQSMADVIRRMWNDYYVADDIGFPQGAVQKTVSQLCDVDASAVFEHLVRSADEIRWQEFLSPLGLSMQALPCGQGGWLGIDTKTTSGDRVEITYVAHQGPAENAGLYAGDQLVAIDGAAVEGRKLEELLAGYSPDVTVPVHVIRRGRLVDVEARLGKRPPAGFKLDVVDDPTARQKKLLRQWLGATNWETQ